MTARRLLPLLLGGWLVMTGIPLVISAPAHAAKAAKAAEAAAEPEPLTVRLTRLTPSAIPTAGKITLAGTVTNSSDEEWQDINVAPFFGRAPMTTREELADAAQTPIETDVGPRLDEIGQFAPIGDLAPGTSATFVITLPRAELATAGPGVYWIGVHALGSNADGRDSNADGRARTFIPLVAPGASASVAVVVPLRAEVRRDSQLRLADPDRWSKILAPEGRLDRIVNLAASANPGTVSLVTDPAVLDAAQTMAQGNPSLSLAAATETPDPTSDASPSESPSATPTQGSGTEDPDVTETDRTNASDWLRRLTESTAAQKVLGLGYADPDVAALARLDPTLLKRSEDRSSASFEEHKITAEPAVAPPSGWLGDEQVRRLASGTVVLLTDHGNTPIRSQWQSANGLPLTFADTRTSSGGPDPTPPLDALALRQRIISDAAIRAQSGIVGTLVVTPPSHWDPGADWVESRFFEGLDKPWLTLTTLSGATSTALPTYPAELRYPQAQQRLEVGPENVTAANQLVRTGAVLDQLVSAGNDVASIVAGAALAATSYDARADKLLALREINSIDAGIQARMRGVKVTGTEFVTLSGGSGSLTVTLVNDLDVPVTVGLRAEISDDHISIRAPKPVEMAPKQRTTLRLLATADSIGVHEIILTPVTRTGEPLGTPLEFSLRTSQVGKLIWGILIGGGVLLAVMIVIRIVKRIRTRKWRQ